jgi:pyruvate dehydrogenase E2 component (dihydrolipoamide acetyltransferase)
MPKLSDTMEEGGIASWLKKEGEYVDDGEALVEIETDKATMEYASPEEGYLLKIVADAGAGVALDGPICVLGEEKDEKFDLDKLVAESGGSTSAPKKDEAPAASTPAPAASTPAPSAPAPVAQSSGGRVKASPLAKKIAESNGIDIGAVSGTGPNGRVVQRDVEQAISSGVGSSSGFAAASRADKKVPLSMMRKTIAKRLLAGKNDAPHFYLTVSANMENMLAFRAQLNKNVGKVEGLPKVSVNDLVMLASAKALRLHPTVNSSWQGDHILEHGNVNISMAVALPTGLVTPVIRNADQLGVRDISVNAKALGKKAKDGNITNEDLAGGTFTISNLGMTKVEEFTAIINPPQAAILAVGTTKEVAHVENGEITVQKRMKMTLSSDHRVIDGMVGAQFLETLVEFIENPSMMLA